MSKPSAFGLIKCPDCGNTVFSVSNEVADDPIIKCKCGAVLGPSMSLEARARGEPHTPVNVATEKEPKPKG